MSNRLLFLGYVLIVAGVAMIYPPAGLIVAGLFSIITAYLIEKEKANAPVE